jgi:hypothetical protein
MKISEIEEAVDRIIAKREQSSSDKVEKESITSSLSDAMYSCPERKERKKLRNPVKPPLGGQRQDVICPGRHSSVVDSLVSSKKKAM